MDENQTSLHTRSHGARGNKAIGYSEFMLKIRSVANWFRSFIRFKIRQRWIKTNGMTRIHRFI